MSECLANALHLLGQQKTSDCPTNSHNNTTTFTSVSLLILGRNYRKTIADQLPRKYDYTPLFTFHGLTYFSHWSPSNLDCRSGYISICSSRIFGEFFDRKTITPMMQKQTRSELVESTNRWPQYSSEKKIVGSENLMNHNIESCVSFSLVTCSIERYHLLFLNANVAGPSAASIFGC